MPDSVLQLSDEPRLLVVDDDLACRELFARRLAKQGFEVFHVASVDEAWSNLNRTKFDGVLLDIAMPRHDGFSLLRRIRNVHDFKRLPVVMLSNQDQPDTVARAMRDGADDYVLKTTRFPDIVDRLREVLRKSSSEHSAIGHYVLHSLLGKGAMGTVHRAFDPQTSRWVAIKIISPELAKSESSVLRFVREGETASRIWHPNLVRAYGSGWDGDLYFLVMELVEGQTLEGEVLAPKEALHVIRQLAQGVRALHKAGVIHRDIKPANIIRSSSGSVKLVDFGVARDFSHGAITCSGVTVGSTVYSSMEQINGCADNRSDIYSIGCTFYELIAGIPPFDKDLTLDKLMLAKKRRVPKTLRAPRAMRMVMKQMMAIDPVHRYQTIDELCTALDTLARG